MTNPGGYRYDLERRDEIAAASLSSQHLTALFATPFARPAEIDPRPWSKVRNQQNEGSCQGHALTAAQEQCHFAATSTFRQFSPDWAYYQSQAKDGLLGRDAGSTISGGLYVAANLGALPEEKMPYSPSYNPGAMPQNGKQLAAEFVVRNFAELKSYTDIIEWLGRGFGSVWWGTAWGVEPDAQGFIRHWRESGGGHATGLLGYSREKSGDGLPEWLWLKNSWGTSWGLSGWAKVTRAAVEEALRNPNTVIGAISDMEHLQPRVIDWTKHSVFA